ncbi:MAG: response regulator [Bacteroidales bacterium]|nr:response regulator [Bacteroidales bacterium]
MNSIKILVVDDDIESLKVIVLQLQRSNPEFKLFQSNSSVKAISIAQKILPDLIITDWDMPEINGIEFIRNLKNNESTKTIPFVVASGVMVTSENLKIALEAGAVDFLRKPIDSIELQARINSAIMISKLHKEIIEGKNHELAEYTLNLVKNNEFMIELKEKLKGFSRNLELIPTVSSELDLIIEDLSNKIRTDSWDRFNIAFYNIHPNFNNKLLKKYPNLSPAELKLCILIRIGMSIKDVAAVLYQSMDSIKVSRSRLRKKLNLDQDQNLEVFLSAF